LQAVTLEIWANIHGKASGTAIGGIWFSHKVEMWLDKTNIQVNGQNKTIDVAPTTINGRTMVSVRFVADNIPGCGISWDGDTKSVVITYEP